MNEGLIKVKIYASHLHYDLVLLSESNIIAEYVTDNKGITFYAKEAQHILKNVVS